MACAKENVANIHHPIVCANCGIVIRWRPTILDGRIYCCLGCAKGGPCECDYDNLPPTGAVHPIVIHKNL